MPATNLWSYYGFGKHERVNIERNGWAISSLATHIIPLYKYAATTTKYGQPPSAYEALNSRTQLMHRLLFLHIGLVDYLDRAPLRRPAVSSALFSCQLIYERVHVSSNCVGLHEDAWAVYEGRDAIWLRRSQRKRETARAEFSPKKYHAPGDQVDAGSTSRIDQNRPDRAC